MNYILKTENLLLREFDTSDSIFIVQLLNSPGWIEYIGDRNIKGESEAIHYLLNSPIKSYTEHGFGLYMVETIENKIPVGMCGLIKRATLDKPDIGYAFLPEYNGKGFAFESAVGVLNYAKVKLNIEIIIHPSS
jgi:RimJ/RimL family protein N-acetyltransferase